MDVFSLPLQFVFVESINRFVVALDEASASVFTSDVTLATRGDEVPLFDEAVPLEPIPEVRPDDDGCNCCHGGILSLFLSRRLASSNEIFFLFAITCLANREDQGFASETRVLPCSMAVLPPSRVPNGRVPPGVKPFNVRISSLCSLKEDRG